jgi:hypothetical protein
MTWRPLSIGLPICLILFLAASAAESAAPDASLSPALANIIANPEHQKAVIAAAQQSSAWMNNRCAGATFAIGGDVAIYQRLELDQQQRPAAGSWRERVTAQGCGANRVLNVLTFVKSPGRLVSGTLLPGTTHADPLLQRDAFRYAAAAAKVPPNCSTIYVADTAFAGVEGAANASLPPQRRIPPWKEEWTIAACGQRSAVTLHFVPDATGTNITTSPGETRSGG